MSGCPIYVTFIGGSADLTRRVFDQRELGPIVSVPVMPASEPRRYGEFPPTVPERVVCNVETYVVRQIGKHHAVALLEHLR